MPWEKLLVEKTERGGPADGLLACAIRRAA